MDDSDQSDSSSFLEENPQSPNFLKASHSSSYHGPSSVSASGQLCGNKENEKTSTPGIKSLIQAFPNEEHTQIIQRIEASWDLLQLPKAELEKRHKVISDGIGHNLTQILQHAFDLQTVYQQNLHDRVEKYTADIRNAEQMLNLTPDSSSGFEEGHNVGLYQREVHLRARCNELLALRGKRQTMWNALMADNQKFARATGLPPFFLADHNSRLRTENLEGLQACNNDLQAVYVVRSRTMAGLRQNVDSLSLELKETPSQINWEDLTEPNIQAAQFILTNFNEIKSANVKKSTEILNRIKYLCRRTGTTSLLLDSQPAIVDRLYDPDVIGQLTRERDRLEHEAKQNIRNVILRLRDRILTLYAETYATAEERAAFQDLTSDEFDEALLDSHEAEVTRLDNLMEDNRPIYGLLAEHALLMREKLKFEEQETDPVVMVNRGGILLKIQADKKKVIRDLQKVTSDLRLEVEKKSLPEGLAFLISGQTLDDFFNQRQREMEHEKADFIKDRKTAPGSAMKRGKDFKDKETPTFKRLKNEAGGASGVKAKTFSTEAKSSGTTDRTFVVEPRSGRAKDKEPPPKKDTVDRIGKIKRRLVFDGSSAVDTDKSKAGKTNKARPAVPSKARVPTPLVAKGHH